MKGGQTHCHGCMGVTWALFWGKPGQEAGDERHLVCAAGVAGGTKSSWFLLCVL